MDKETEKRTPLAEHPEELANLIAFVEEHGLTILIAVCVAIVVVTGSSVWKTRRQEKAFTATAQLRTANTVPELESIMGKYAGTGAAPLAGLKLAKTHFNMGKYDAALDQYDTFLRTHAEHALADVARVGRLHCLEAQGKVDEALQGFKAFAEQNRTHFLYADAVFSKARCLEQAGRLDDARAVYEDFITADPKSPWKNRAEEYLNGVNRKLKRAGKSAPAVAAAPATPPPVTGVATNKP